MNILLLQPAKEGRERHIAAISAEVFRKLLCIVDGGECIPRKERDTADISAYRVYYSMKGALTAEDIEMPLTGNVEHRLLYRT